jgi:hypothetical protein
VGAPPRPPCATAHQPEVLNTHPTGQAGQAGSCADTPPPMPHRPAARHAAPPPGMPPRHPASPPRDGAACRAVRRAVERHAGQRGGGWGGTPGAGRRGGLPGGGADTPSPMRRHPRPPTSRLTLLGSDLVLGVEASANEGGGGRPWAGCRGAGARGRGGGPGAGGWQQARRPPLPPHQRQRPPRPRRTAAAWRQDGRSQTAARPGLRMHGVAVSVSHG